MKIKCYCGVDLLKLVCSILVVFLHTYCYDLGYIGRWIQSVICPIAVPCFFIVSGFFFTKGLIDSSDAKEYTKRYFIRILKIYIFWTIISLPVAIYNINLVHYEYQFVFKIVYLIRCFIFSGSLGIYWYLLSLLYLSLLIYFIFIKKLDNLLYLLSLICFSIGILYVSGFLNETIIFKIIHMVFGSERNFINVGLPYMSIGYYFAKNEKVNINNNILIIGLIFSIVLKTVETLFFKISIFHSIIAFFVFLISLNLSLDMKLSFSKEIRKISTGIYLIHFNYILLFDYYLQKGTFLDFFSTLLFSILIYIIMNIFLPKKYCETILGK